MTTELHGSGVAASCAAGLLTNLASRMRASCDEQVEYVETVRDEFAAEFLALRAQRDHARDVACRYEAEVARLQDLVAAYQEQDRLRQLSA